MQESAPVTRLQLSWQIFTQACVVILANVSVPLVNITDTAVIGQTGDVRAVAAIGMATVLFNLIYWSFGFLRMATTGFVAQAAGKKNAGLLQTEIMRALSLALLIGLVLIILQWPLQLLGVYAMDAGGQTAENLKVYFHIRIWDAPATLMNYAILGSLIGIGQSRLILMWQLVLNGLNILFDCLLVLVWHHGIEGVAWGTVIANYSACIFGLWLIFRHTDIHRPLQAFIKKKAEILDPQQLKQFFAVNGNILIRTLALTFCFFWFTRQGGQISDQTVAANQLLLQFISFSAYIVDGFSNVGEMYTGQTYGARRPDEFRQKLSIVAVFAAGIALLLGLAAWGFDEPLLRLFTSDQELLQTAAQFSIFAAIYVFASFPAFLLDGIFVGVTYSSAMRNSTLAGLIALLVLSLILQPIMGNVGLWLAMIICVVARAVVLGFYYPEVLRRMQPGNTAPPAAH